MKKFSFLFLLLFPVSAWAQSYFIMGSGELQMKDQSSGASTKIQYRDKNDKYDENGLRKIHSVYGANYDDITQRMPLRFIEVLSNIQDHFNGAMILIRSGYRSPNSNQKLRDQGKLAGQSSMHIEASAMDFYLQGVDVLALKEYATTLPCCGVGYYHGKHIHLDTGPKRWWDETNSGTEKKEPQENEKVITLTNQDIYKSSEKVFFDLARVTNFPIGITANVNLEKFEKGQWVFAKNTPLDFSKVFPPHPSASNLEFDPKRCVVLQSRKEIRQIALDKNEMPAGRYHVKINFCNKQWAKMPDSIDSNEFEIRK